MRKRKPFSLLLALCLAVSLLPTIAAAAQKNPRELTLDTADIQGYQTKGTGTYDYVYFGTYGGEPIKWRVLDDKTNTGNRDGIFLLSEDLLGTGIYGNVSFDSSDTSCAYQGSDAQAWNTDFYNSSLTAAEQNAVLPTDKDDEWFASGGYYELPYTASAGILNGDKMFFLSVEEAENAKYGFADDTTRMAHYKDDIGFWWLRSPYEDEYGDMAAQVASDGIICAYGLDTEVAARPAFNLDKNAVLFVSVAAEDKTGEIGTLSAIGNYAGNRWKLTLKDDSRDFGVKETSVSGKAGKKVKLTYGGAKTGDNEYISAIIADEQGIPLYYGRVAQSIGDKGKATVTIPADLADGTYTVKLFNEQYNGGMETGISSAFADVTLTVSNSVIRLLIGILASLTAICIIAIYIIRASSLYRLGKSAGISSCVLAWIPIANAWVAGAIANKFEEKNGGEQKLHKGLTMIVILCGCVIFIGLVCTLIYALI